MTLHSKSEGASKGLGKVGPFTIHIQISPILFSERFTGMSVKTDVPMLKPRLPFRVKKGDNTWQGGNGRKEDEDEFPPSLSAENGVTHPMFMQARVIRILCTKRTRNGEHRLLSLANPSHNTQQVKNLCKVPL